MVTLEQEQEQAIREFLAGRKICAGLGTEEESCSVGTINLALLGRLTDEIPPCMSLVIGRWIIGVQDWMPDAMRNSAAWRELLPLAAGTGRDPEKEQARLELVLDWMWGTVLPQLQPLADQQGFGADWRKMCVERTAAAAEAAEAAALDAEEIAGNAAAVVAKFAADAAAAGAEVWMVGAVEAAAAAAASAAALVGVPEVSVAARRKKSAWAAFEPAALLARLVAA